VAVGEVRAEILEMMHSDRLPEDVCKKFVPYVQDLQKIHGENLLSVFIYGSATGVNYQRDISDVNSGFVFQTLDFSVFEKSLKVVSTGLKQKISAPLFLTKRDIHSSRDVFPIEFLDMKEHHVLLYGEDVLSSLEIHTDHLRLFCEQEIKGKLIRLQQAYLEVGLNAQKMAVLLKDSLNSLFPIFRNFLRLKNHNPPIEKVEIIAKLSREFALDQQTLLKVYHYGGGEKKWASAQADVLFANYLEQVHRLAIQIDQI
jgi:hypothetical protein